MSEPGLPDRPVTIYDVAAAAKVSPSTVSRTFSRPGRVSVRTADHVRAIAEQLGYRAEQVFRPVEPKRRHTIGLTVADATNPFYFGILRGAEAAATRAGYHVLLIDTAESAAHEQDCYTNIMPLVDALIVTSSRMSDTVLRGFAKSHPVVVLNRYVGGLPCVVPDTDDGIRQALGHLAAFGHRQIAYLPGPDASWMSGRRWLGLREAAPAFGMSVHRLPPVIPTVEGGYSAAATVAERHASAILCYNDLSAIGLMRGLKEAGAEIPADYSLVGFDNIFASDLVTPPLTTVAAPMSMLGKTAVGHVLALLSGARPRSREAITVPAKLIKRSSTGPNRATA